MKRRAGIMMAGTFLALGFWSLSAYSADDDEDQKMIAEAQKAVIKLTESMNGKKGDVKGQAEAIHKKFPDLKHVMWVYKPRKKGGIGMGPEGDSIETEIARIGNPRAKQKFTPKKLAEVKQDLIKAGELSRAMAEVADLYAPKKNTAKWKEYTRDMRKGAAELIEATKTNDVTKVKQAANKLSASCTQCHADFRND